MNMKFSFHTEYFAGIPRCLVTRYLWNCNQNIVELFTRPICKEGEWRLYSWLWAGWHGSEICLNDVFESTRSLREMLDLSADQEPLVIGISSNSVYLDWQQYWSNRRHDPGLQNSLQSAIETYVSTLR
jgi:hypothetical protein